jgi:hypothetical protein
VTVRRTPKPFLLLLLALVALLAPPMAKPSVAAPTSGIARTAAVSQLTAATSHRNDVEHRQSDRPELRGVTGQSGASLTSAKAHDPGLPAPRFVLVQRPRPPTDRATGAGPRAATGRSPPSPAGT